ncbi:3-deoxy-D-manno-octulosonic acid transferase [Simplicispira psychrophila]|uniref:3-deoxy-D-manno-octulosonic acid transferase n=1 Tax=Simplicispira psychrophila TaxID=80882 RepID=UPI00048466DF|nr:3-deoxy-D-manno-octulosonic acid transferase [Simplicispira psychrophila]
MAHAALWLYSALTWVAQPLLLRKLRRRAVAEPGYGQHVGERFGHYAASLDSLAPSDSRYGADPASPLVWVHAVSLGETRAAAILLDALRQQLPGMRLLLTHGTATGRCEGEKLLQPGDVQVWQPWDTRAAVARFLRRFRPAIGILIETELWPNLAAACRAQGVPLVLANARLSDKSQRQAQRLAWLARPAYAGLTAVWAQTEADAERLRNLGAPVQGVFGNLKFDVVPDAAQLAQGRAGRARSARPVVLLASSREGEEALWLESFRSNRPLAQSLQAPTAIKNEVTDGAGADLLHRVQWLIVPRHPQRFEEVAQLLQRAGLRVVRRSQGTAAQPAPADVWLGDSLGEMARYYGLADVALLGGSFAPLGGQNLIEAAACGCPVVLGPHTFNFAEAAALACTAGAAQRVDDMAQGMATACALAQDGPSLAQARVAAVQFAQAHQGAAHATALAVAALLQGA